MFFVWFSSLVLGVRVCFYVSIQLTSEFTKERGQELSNCVGLTSGRWRTLKAQTLCFQSQKLTCHPVFTEHLSHVRNPSHRNEAFRKAVAAA